MSILNKIYFSLILILTLYILAIFFTPTEADMVWDKLWISGFNFFIRNLKWGADNVSEQMLQLKTSESIIDQARNTVNQTNEVINQTKNAINTKIEQADKTIESWKKLIDATNEFKQNVSTLSDFSWSLNSTWSTSSWVTNTGLTN